MTFQVIDYIFAVVLLIFAIVAALKGFINEVFGKASWILGILFGIFFYPQIAKLLSPKINNMVICNVLGFLIIFAAVFLIILLVGKLLSSIFQGSVVQSLDRALGFFFGLIEGLAIIGLVIFLLQLQPFFDASALLENSFFFKIFTFFIKSQSLQEITPNV